MAVTLSDGSEYNPSNGQPGTDNTPIGRFGIQADSAGATLDSVFAGVEASLNTKGVLTLELWHSVDDTFDVQQDSLLSAQEWWSLDNLPDPFTDLDLPIPTTQEYVFVAMDLDDNARGYVVPTLSDSMLTISGGPSSVKLFIRRSLPPQKSVFAPGGRPHGPSENGRPDDCGGETAEIYLV